MGRRKRGGCMGRRKRGGKRENNRGKDR